MRRILVLSTILLMASSEAFSSEKNLPPSPFQKNKFIVTKTSKKKFTANSSAMVASVEQNLIALMDMDCVGKHGLKSLQKYNSEVVLVDHTPHLRSHRKVLKLKMQKTLSDDRLTQFANSSACIIGISNDAEYRTSAFNDPSYGKQTQHPFLKTEEYYNKATWYPATAEDRAVVAVIDTGVDYRHADLTNVMFRKDGNVVGASFVPSVPDFHDDHGHGTHVAGLAAAEANNGRGGIGVCGMSCSIMPIKVLSKDGSGYLSDITNGVFWAIDHGADILNMSLGRSMNFAGMAPIELEAFRYAMMNNVMVAVAAGNDGATLSMDGPQTWPAMFAGLPGLVTVGSLDASSGALSTFSNRSSKYVEIAAPGSTSSVNGVYVGLYSTATGGGYASMSGTSMATPVVAGAMGLIVSYFKKFNIPYSVWDIEAFLKSSTVNNPSLNPLIEAGRVLNLSVLADELQANHDDPYRLDVHDAYESFVIDLYYVIMRRNYDTGGAQYNLNLMQAHQYPLESLLLSFFNSAEFKQNFGTINSHSNDNFSFLKDHFIPDVYLMILGRLATAAESDYWTTYLNVYRNKYATLMRELLKSPEFTARIAGTDLATYPRFERLPSDASQRCNSYDFKGDLSLEKQVDYAYCMVLERTPDAGGREWFISLLRNGVTLETIITMMFQSSEFKDTNDLKNVSDRSYVNILYYSLLQRLPASHEAHYWMQVLQTQSKDAVFKAILSSGEFSQVLKTKNVRR